MLSTPLFYIRTVLSNNCIQCVKISKHTSKHKVTHHLLPVAACACALLASAHTFHIFPLSRNSNSAISFCLWPPHHVHLSPAATLHEFIFVPQSRFLFFQLILSLPLLVLETYSLAISFPAYLFLTRYPNFSFPLCFDLQTIQTISPSFHPSKMISSLSLSHFHSSCFFSITHPSLPSLHDFHPSSLLFILISITYCTEKVPYKFVS